MRSMVKGYAGKILKVNLTTKTFDVECPTEDFYRKYIGGSSLSTYFLLKEMEPGIDALDPESLLIFATGPLAGSTISGTCRHSVTAKSPMTGGVMSSEGGGYWAAELKKAGFDAVIIKGKAEQPSWLWIHNGEYELRTAPGIYGKTTKEVQEYIRKETDDKFVRVAQIGPSGEQLCMYANIVNELAHFNGRGGLGAVMGSKNLRAIAVRGTMKPDWYDAAGMAEYAKEMAKDIREDEGFQDFKENGTIGCVDEHIGVSGLPTRNWTSGIFEKQEELTTDAWKDIIKPGTCYACAQSCKRHVDPKKTSEIDPAYGGPEYETIGMCGSNLGIANRVTICKINEIAAKYAFDTISFGATVSFLIECFEKGYIDEDYTEGRKLSYGDEKLILELAQLTGKGIGFGKKIAQGSARLAEEIGEKSKDLLITVKGKEFPAHMPQTKTAVGLMYAFTPIGADHVSGEMDGNISQYPISEDFKAIGCDSVEDPFELNLEKSKFLWRSHLAYSFMDSACVCILAFGFGMARNLEGLVEAINLATGWDMGLYEMQLAGERRVQMMRAFNVREGLTVEDDELPKKLYTPLKGGVTDHMALDREQFKHAKSFYYDLAGWSEKDGKPSANRLRAVNLEWMAETE